MTDRRLYAEDETTVLNEDPADTTPLFVDGSYGDLAFAPVLAGDGFVMVAGDADLAFAPVISGDGFVAVDGTGAITFGLSVAGSGTVGAVDPPIPNPQAGSGGRNRITRTPRRVTGTGHITFAISLAATGEVNDDDLVLALAA